MISRFTKQLKGTVILGALLVGSNAFAQLGLTWSEMGPNDIAGRCRSIIVDNTDASGNKMFAAGVSGGIFKTADGGATWSQVNDQSSSLIVSCMAQHLTNGKIYFGTGETFSRGGDGAGSSGFVGTGLYSITSPSTITQVKDSSVFGNINEVAVSSAGYIYVAGEKGFFISTDNGATFNEETVSATGTLAAMDVKLATNGDIYYSAGSKSSSTSAVYYCPFGSTIFTTITPTAITDRGRIEIAPSPVDPNYVYLSIAKQKTIGTTTTNAASGGLSAVLVSNNKGSTWTTITIGTAQFDPLTNGTKGFGDYANTIVADPVKKDALYLGGNVFYSWTQIASNPLGQGTWQQIGTNFQIPFAVFIHSNIHAVIFNGGNGSMYIATDGGIFKSVSSNSGFLPYNKGLNISQFNSVAYSSFPRVTQTTNTLSPYAGVAGGSIGNSLNYMSGAFLNGPQTSTSFGTTDAFQSDFSSISPKVLFYSGAFGTIFRSSDIDVSAPSTFYDNSYKGAVHTTIGSPGSSAFANENTPMRLWEGNTSAIFYNGIINSSFPTTSSTQTTFTFVNARPQTPAKYDTIYVVTTSSKNALKPLAVTQTFTNTNTSATSFTAVSTRSNVISKYDSVIVKMTSFKKSNLSVIVPTYTNTNNTAATFTIANTRPMASAKYDSIIVKSTSFKLDTTLASPTKKTIIIRPTYSLNTITGYNVTGGPTGTLNVVFLNNTTFNDVIRFTFNAAPKDSTTFNVRIKYKYAQTIYIMPAYTSSLITGYNVIGEANIAANNNTITLNNVTLIDNIRYTFIDPPNDSSVISVRTKNRYYQTIKIMPAYTGTAITSYSIIGEANNTPTTNIKVILNNSTLLDTIRYTFKNAPNDSCTINNSIKLRYNAGDIINLKNTDVSGMQYTASITLTTALAASITPQPIVYVPLKKSARLGIGTSASSNGNSGNSPSIYVVKRPLNFAINPDWVKIAGSYSRVDSAGGTPYLATTGTVVPNAFSMTPILGATVTRLEWAPDGNSIYFSSKLNDTTFYLYRISHLQFIGDSAAEDYSGAFSSDLDSSYHDTPKTYASTRRKSVKQRTTPLGMFKYPITSISVSADNANVMLTFGGYKNFSGNVYYSNSDVRTMNLNNTDGTNFTVKQGTGLPTSPVYTSIFEMNDNKRAIIGTESGIYSSMDITQPSPTWTKEGGGNFPNVPVFQIRQQTLPAWLCYNSGMIYVGTHGRGIWSTGKYFTPYAIGINEETSLSSNTNIRLYPNPANDATNLWFNAAGDAKYNVTVYDVNGKIIIQHTTGKLMEGEQLLTINTAELNAGIYFVTVNGSNNFNANTKLVITH